MSKFKARPFKVKKAVQCTEPQPMSRKINGQGDKRKVFWVGIRYHRTLTCSTAVFEFPISKQRKLCL